MTNEEIINKKLVETYGCELDGRPRYRLVWSDSATELRRGVHTKWYKKIWLGEWIGVKECKKYTYIHERWILEKLQFFPVKELVDSEKGHYEPIWVFYDPQGGYQRPELKYVLYAINTLQNGGVRDKAYWESEEAKRDAAEMEYYEQVLGFDYIPTMLHNREAIIVPGGKS